MKGLTATEAQCLLFAIGPSPERPASPDEELACFQLEASGGATITYERGHRWLSATPAGREALRIHEWIAAGMGKMS